MVDIAGQQFEGLITKKNKSEENERKCSGFF